MFERFRSFYKHESYSDRNESYGVGFVLSCQLILCKAHFCSSNSSEVTSITIFKLQYSGKIDRTCYSCPIPAKDTPFNSDFRADFKMVRHNTVALMVQKKHL
jgi:hypothetical protein